MAYLTPVVRGENGAMLFTGTTAQLLSFLCYDLLTTHVFAVAFASICRCVFEGHCTLKHSSSSVHVRHRLPVSPLPTLAAFWLRRTVHAQLDIVAEQIQSVWRPAVERIRARKAAAEARRLAQLDQ